MFMRNSKWGDLENEQLIGALPDGNIRDLTKWSTAFVANTSLVILQPTRHSQRDDRSTVMNIIAAAGADEKENKY